MFQSIIAIGLGSCCGGVLRWLLSQFFQRFSFYHYPLGTFVVNILGCFCIGMFYALFEKYNIGNQSLKLFLTVGFCGSFTTFSTFINENVSLLQNDQISISLLYLLASLLFGACALMLGTIVVKAIA
ncbi:MAG: fluoride efflux transporter CrcB [Bacteroidales bacterium]|nr:fluoride efflux transporter CrcB [Bacteroidales bacterium]